MTIFGPWAGMSISDRERILRYIAVDSASGLNEQDAAEWRDMVDRLGTTAQWYETFVAKATRAGAQLLEQLEQSMDARRLMPPDTTIGSSAAPAGRLATQVAAEDSRFRRRRSRPPAQSEIAPADWLGMLERASKAGEVTREQSERAVKTLLDRDAGSQAPPAWPVIEAIGLEFERDRHKYPNMVAFADAHGISRATLDRYLKAYEAATGKQIRPGKGRRKKRKKNA